MSTAKKKSTEEDNVTAEDEEMEDAAAAMDDQENSALDVTVSEEYKIWKKNAPFLYDLVITHILEWPSLTCCWVPERVQSADKSCDEHKLVLGTLTEDSVPNYLLIASVKLPYDLTQPDTSKEEDEYGRLKERVTITQKIAHNGEVNRARCMPQNSHLIATKSPSCDVCVFDTSKLPMMAAPTDKSSPLIKLTGHTKEGYGLSWSPVKPGFLLSGSYDSVICLWDTNSPGADSQNVKPLQLLTTHTEEVEDVQWHPKHDSLFGSVGDDKQLIIWDTREPSKPSSVVSSAHPSAVHGLSFNPFVENLLATSSADQTVALWDMRNLKQKIHELKGHKGEVWCISWSPFYESIIASASSDRRIHIWDVTKIGAKQSAEDAKDGPPELLFIHGGHVADIRDFSWDCFDPWLIASVAEGSNLQTWKLTESARPDSYENESSGSTPSK